MGNRDSVSLSSSGPSHEAVHIPERQHLLPEHSKTTQEQTSKPSVTSADVRLFVTASLKIGGGMLAGAVGVSATTLVLPLALLGLGAGALIGRQKSMLEANSMYQKEMAIEGLIAGSFCLASYLLLSKELTTSGYKDIKHRNETPVEKQQRMLNKEIKHLTSELKFLESKKFSKTDVSEKIGEVEQKLQRRENHVKAIVSQVVVDHIFHDVMANASSVSEEQQAAVKAQISAEVKHAGGKNAHVFLIEGKEYVVSEVLNDKQKAVAIAVAKKGSELGAGTFGTVYELSPTLFGLTKNSTSTGQRFVTKTPKLQNEDNRQDFQNDAKITQHLNRHGSAVAIPLPSHFIECNGDFRLILPQNEMTLDKLPRDTIKSNMQAFLDQAWAGVDHMHNEGVWQRDIKTENIMIRTNDEGRPELVFIDFGGSKLFDEIFNGKEFPSLYDLINPKGMTPAFKSAEIHKAICDLYGKYEKEYDQAKQAGKGEDELSQILQRMKDEMVPLLKQSDRFSTGMTLYAMVTGESIKPTETNRITGVSFTNKETSRKDADNKLLASGLSDPQSRQKIVDALFPVIN